MRRLLTFVLSLSMVLSLAALPARADTTETTTATEVMTEPTTVPTTVPETEAVTEPATEPSTEPQTEPMTEPSTEAATESTTEPTESTADVQTQVGSLSVTVHDAPAGAVLVAQELPVPLFGEDVPGLEILFDGRFDLKLYLGEEEAELGPFTVTVEGLPEGGEFLVTQESVTLTERNGGVDVKNGAVSFQMDNFSWFAIKQYRLLHSRPVIPSIESDKPEDRMVLNKFVAQEDDGSLSLYLEAYATGYLKPKPTEIVLVMDQSGSMYSAMNSKRVYSYQEFLASHPTGDRNETYPGYYLSMTKSSEADGYAAALVWWNGSAWVRSQQVEISETEYLTRKTGFTYPDSKIRETASLKGCNYDGPDAVYFKTVVGAAMDGLGAFLREIEGLPGCKVAVTGFASPEFKIRKGYSDADGLWENEKTSHTNSPNPHRMGGTGVYVNKNLQLDGVDYSRAFLKADDSKEFEELSQTIRSIKTCYWNTVTEAGLRNANEILNAGGREDSSRIVVMFTDGKPDSTSDGTGNPAPAAVDAAGACKENGAQVYVFGPADLSSDPKVADLIYKVSSNQGGENNYVGFADDAESLERFFAQLGQKIVYDNFLMGPDTVLKDVISDSFTLNGNPQAWSVSVIRDLESGNIRFDNDPAAWQVLKDGISVDGQTVSVQGFDYRQNLIPADQPAGAKLVVKLPIKASDGYGGDGQDVPTNGPGSALFDKDGKKINSFREPAVDLRTTVTVKKQVVGRDLGEAFGFHAGYTLAHRYEDTGGTLAQTLEAGGNSFGGNHLDAVTEPAEASFKLKHGGSWQGENVPIGSTFTVRETENSLYATTVLVDGSPRDFAPDGTLSVTVTPNMTVEFINTSRLADLTIIKQGADPRDENQTFLFRIQGLDADNRPIDQTVTVLGNGSVTVKDLPVGAYRVTEDESWSWRYEAVSMEAAGKTQPGPSMELELTAAGETLTCTNRRIEGKWLDGSSYCQNLFGENGIERKAGK